MKKYLLFENAGVLDFYNLVLMGASTKTGDPDTIGEYGSGWKYAIACLVRHDLELIIISGNTEYKIATKDVWMGGKIFDMITVNGKDAMFTSTLGPDWELWMAIREIYCNSIDAGSNTAVVTDQYFIESLRNKGASNRTYVFIEVSPEVEDIIADFQDYFSFERTDDILKLHGCTIYKKRGHKSIIYRKGIQIAVSTKKGCFDYDFDSIPINEIRQAKDFADVENQLKHEMKNTLNADVLQQILESEDTWEKEINFYVWDSIRESQKTQWNQAIGTKAVVPAEYTKSLVKEDVAKETILKLPAMLSQMISLQLPEKLVLGYDSKGTMMIDQECNQAEDIALNEAIVCNMLLFKMDGISFRKVNFNNSYTKSSHGVNEVSIADSIIESLDVEVIALYIFKEMTKMKTGFRDNSSELQDYLFENLFKSLIIITT